MLRPPESQRMPEAFFVFGRLGSAKSSVWDNIAYWYRQTNTPGHFHVLSTEPERAYVLVEQHKDWEQNITIYEPERNFGALMQTSQLINSVGTRDDFFVVDTIGAALDWSRDNWFEGQARFGKGWKEVQAEGVSVAKTVEPFEWTQMNSMYRKWMLETFFAFKGNRIAIAQGEALPPPPNSGSDWYAQHRSVYGRVGHHPLGKKDDDFYFHSVFFANSTAPKKFTLTTIKDRPGRDYLDKAEVMALPGGFVATYLMPVAGWTMED